MPFVDVNTTACEATRNAAEAYMKFSSYLEIDVCLISLNIVFIVMFIRLIDVEYITKKSVEINETSSNSRVLGVRWSVRIQNYSFRFSAEIHHQ